MRRMGEMPPSGLEKREMPPPGLGKGEMPSPGLGKGEMPQRYGASNSRRLFPISCRRHQGWGGNETRRSRLLQFLPPPLSLP
jgi:hypothetical protein